MVLGTMPKGSEGLKCYKCDWDECAEEGEGVETAATTTCPKGSRCSKIVDNASKPGTTYIKKGCEERDDFIDCFTDKYGNNDCAILDTEADYDKYYGSIKKCRNRKSRDVGGSGDSDVESSSKKRLALDEDRQATVIEGRKKTEEDIIEPYHARCLCDEDLCNPAGQPTSNKMLTFALIFSLPLISAIYGGAAGSL